MTNTKRKRLAELILIASLALGLAGTAKTQVFYYSTDFDSMTPGSIVGQEGWTNPGGGAYVQSVTPGVGLNGSQAWFLNGTNPNGAVETIATPSFPSVGETSVVDGGPTVSNTFSESFYFRTVSTTDDPGLYISNSLSAPASIRDTWLGIYEQGGQLIFGAYATSADGSFTDDPTASAALQWGQWYQVKVNATFVDGTNNDQVTYTVIGPGNTVVLNATMGSWETYYSAPGSTAEGAPGPVGLSRTTFGLDGGTAGIYIDNFSETVGTPEPSTWAMLAAGLAFVFWRVRRSRA